MRLALQQKQEAPEFINEIQSAQVYYQDFYTNKLKAKFTITQDDWNIIRRDNNPDKRLSEKAKKLLGKIHKLTDQHKEGKSWYSYEQLEAMLDCKKWQVIQIRKEISHIIKSKWRKATKIDGSIKHKVIVFQYTEKGKDILAIPYSYYGKADNSINIHACDKSHTSIKDEKNVIKKTRSSACAHGANIRKISSMQIQTPASDLQGKKIVAKRKKPTNAQKKARVYKPKFLQYEKTKTLAEMPPITAIECSNIQLKSRRDFNLNALNEMLKDMAKRLDRAFCSRAQFLAYFAKCMVHEKRQACQINNENFRITVRMTEVEATEHVTLQKRDNYLNETETRGYTHRTDESQYRAKLVGTMQPWQAYYFLSNLKTIRKVKNTFELHMAKQVELTQYSLKMILQQAQAVGYYCGVEKLQIIINGEK
jgi:hypothetical protein